jgi:hypothetical protein
MIFFVSTSFGLINLKYKTNMVIFSRYFPFSIAKLYNFDTLSGFKLVTHAHLIRVSIVTDF